MCELYRLHHLPSLCCLYLQVQRCPWQAGHAAVQVSCCLWEPGRGVGTKHRSVYRGERRWWYLYLHAPLLYLLYLQVPVYLQQL
jgi:hypothetical protein